MRKIGQIKSSVVSEVSRTSRRDQSARRLRRSLVAGKPDASRDLRLAAGPLGALGAQRHRLWYLDDEDTYGLTYSLTKLPQATIRGSPLPISLASYGLPFARSY